jgi:hypothetical protein
MALLSGSVPAGYGAPDRFARPISDHVAKSQPASQPADRGREQRGGGPTSWRSEMDMKLTECPERGCTAPAEVIEEDLWPSTQGGLMMAKVEGSCGHRFLMPAWKLDLNTVFVLDEATGDLIPFS